MHSQSGRNRTATIRWNRLGCLVLYAISAAACFVFASTAAAQRYDAEPVDEQARRLSAYTTPWIRDPRRYAAERDRFDEYFTKAYFPSMTQFGPQDLEELGEKRYDLFNDILWKTTNTDLQEHLTELAYEAMRPVAFGGGKNYHPAVRYNALLVLGMLDEDYGDDRAQRKPVPLEQVTELFTNATSAAAKATAQDRPVPAFLIVGTLVGLERHARFSESLDSQKREAMSAAVRELLANNPPIIDVDRDVAEWIQLQGATVLARFGSPGPNGAAHQTLLDLLAGTDDRKMTLESRCRLAALFAMINYDGAQVDGAATADKLFSLVVDVAQAEAKRANEFEESQIGGGRFGGIRGGGGAYGQPVEFDRRMLLARMSDLRDGLSALKPALPAEKQQAADAILTAIKNATDAGMDEDLVDLDVTQAVQAAARAMEAAANPGAPPAAEEEVPADAF